MTHSRSTKDAGEPITAGRLSPWRESANIDDREAAEHAARLELRARSPDEVTVRDEYIGLLGVKPGERFLDVGCGSGVVTRALAQRVLPVGQVVGTDACGPLLKIARNWTTVALNFFLFAYVSTVTGLVTAVLVYGVFSGIGEGLERTFISLLGVEEQKGTGFGWYYLIVGFAAIPAGLLFGGIWSIFGAGIAFGVTGVVGLFCAGAFMTRFSERSIESQIDAH